MSTFGALKRGLVFNNVLSTLKRSSTITRSSIRCSSSMWNDPEVVKTYSQMSEFNKHPNGPWQLMVDAVTAHTTDGTILDIASGPGQPAISIASALPDAVVACTDSSQHQVDIANDNVDAARLSNVTCLAADSEDLSQFDDNTFDVVTCCHGYMFTDNKELALSESARVLKSGGLLVATTWNKLPSYDLSLKSLEGVVSDSVQMPSDVYSLQSDKLETMLSNAGFDEIETSNSTYPMNMTSDETTAFNMSTIVVHDVIKDLEPEARDAVVANFGGLQNEFGSFDEAGNYVVVGDFAVTVAKKAGFAADEGGAEDEAEHVSPSTSSRGEEFSKGVVVSYNNRGYGFITPEDDGDDIFVHVTQITDGNSLAANAEVEFILEFDVQKGKYRAVNLTGGFHDASRDAGQHGKKGNKPQRGNNDATIFVASLSWNTTGEDLMDVFGAFNVVDANLIKEREEPYRSRGFAFVTFGDKEEAAAAIATMDGKMVDGRPIRCDVATRNN